MHAKRIVFPAPGRAELEDFEVGEPGPGQVLLECEYSALSPGTERMFMLEDSMFPHPVRIGYSFCGRIAGVGPGVTRFKVGDPIVATAMHASRIVVDERIVSPAPEGIDMEAGSFFNLAHTSLYGLRRARIAFGDGVVVLGQGPVGLLAAKFAQLAGAAPVVAVDLADDRLEVARRMGLPFAVNANDTEQLKTLFSQMPGGGPAAVIEATGVNQVLETALDMVRERGRVVLLSTYKPKDTFEFQMKLFMKGAEMIGAYVNSKPFSLAQTDVEMPSWPPTLAPGTRPFAGSELWSSDDDVRLYLRLLKLGLIDVSPLISHRFKPEQAAEAYGMVFDQDRSLLGGVIRWT